MRIDDGLARFLVQLVADGRSSHTIGQYRRHIRLFAHWAADVGPCCDVSALSHEDLARFLVSPQARTRPDGRVKKHWRRVSRAADHPAKVLAALRTAAAPTAVKSGSSD